MFTTLFIVHLKAISFTVYKNFHPLLAPNTAIERLYRQAHEAEWKCLTKAASNTLSLIVRFDSRSNISFISACPEFELCVFELFYAPGTCGGIKIVRPSLPQNAAETYFRFIVRIEAEENSVEKNCSSVSRNFRPTVETFGPKWCFPAAVASSASRRPRRRRRPRSPRR